MKAEKASHSAVYFLKFILCTFMFMALLGAFLFIWGPGPLPKPGRYEHPIHVYGNPAPTTPADRIRVMTYNLGYGYGLGSDGLDYHPKTHEEIGKAIREIGEVIRTDNIDIVLIQEIDFQSKKSGDINQLKMFFDVRFHSLGHSCVTHAANADISEEIRREHVGHASDVHRGYTHREVQATRNALRAMPSLRPSKQKPA